MPKNFSRRQIMGMISGLFTGAACSRRVNSYNIINPPQAQTSELSDSEDLTSEMNELERMRTTASLYGTIRLWNVETGECIR